MPASLLRLAAGTTVPGHAHTIHEECLVLEGTLKIGQDLVLHAGDFHVGIQGVPHADASTDTGAVVFLREGKPQAEAAGA
jgi:quercetin dioxygenase-like cupin family protein